MLLMQTFMDDVDDFPIIQDALNSALNLDIRIYKFKIQLLEQFHFISVEVIYDSFNVLSILS